MNREVKFRAWDKKKMYNVLDMNYFPEGYGISIDDLIGDRREFLPEEIILMQYTGLKDKNGVEIYEGDMFRPDSLVKPEYLEVKYNEDCACFEPFGNSEYASVPNLGKVIGNIYENPELIKK